MKLKDYKVSLYKLQNGVCPLCNNELDKDIQKNHLDHDHALEGKNAGVCRGLLCGYCNTLEGTLLHKFNRSGLKSKTTFQNYLKNLLTYYDKENDGMIHPKFFTDKIKAFTKLSKPEMIHEIALIAPQESTGALDKKRLINIYRKVMKASKDHRCLN